MKTLSEIDTTSKRAAKGAGFSWGISEEIGKNMRLLELFGLSGIKNLNKYLKDYKLKQFQKIALISEINETKKNPFCPIILGTNFIDQVNLFDKKNNIKIINVAFPILFLPFVSRASEVIGKRIFLKIDEKEFLLNLNQSIFSSYLKNEILENCNSISINFIENNNSFNENEWKESGVYNLLGKIFRNLFGSYEK